MLNFYFNPFASTINIPVYRFTSTEDGGSESTGFENYTVSTFLIKGFIKRISQKEAIKQGIINTGRDIMENCFILTQTELKTITFGLYADMIKWDNQFWEIKSVMKNTVSGIFYECYASLVTDVPKAVTSIQ